MKPVDTDALFEKFMRNYMKENAGKFTEEEWEDKIPVLFDEFGKTPLQELGGESPSSICLSRRAQSSSPDIFP